MRKSILGLFLLLAITVMAGLRTPEQAAEIAAQFTNQQPQLRYLHKTARKASNMRLAHKALQQNSENAAFYVFNQEGNNGFVIVSADDRTAEDILGYSENGSFNANTINPNLQWWLNRYAEEITVLQTIDDSEFVEQPATRKLAQVEAIEPLLVNQKGQEITWYQETPYNNLCPIDSPDNTRCFTGCVATAAAMIMYKWRWPYHGNGSSSYTWQNCTKYNYWGECQKAINRELTANYKENVYEWAKMLPSYNVKGASPEQMNAVATLMYDCGVASEMQYGGDEAGGSGTLTDYMAYGLKTYFAYKFEKFITMYSQREYGNVKGNIPVEYNVTREEVQSYFDADLEAGRPIIMGGGERDGSGGHEFICCGRDANGKYYINWGWEGDANGYYTLSALKPQYTDYNLSYGLDAIIGLEPDKTQGIETPKAENKKSTKIIENGQIVIVRDDVRYTVLGQIIR